MKFSQIDKEFLTNRENIFSMITQRDPSYFIDQIGLFIGHVALGSLLCRYELLKKTIDIPGHILEFGVFEGANLLYMAKILKLLCPNNLKQVYGFDSFKGFCKFSKNDFAANKFNGAYKGNKPSLEKLINLHKLNEDISLIPGFIENTLPTFLKAHPQHVYSFIYIDVDLYRPTQRIFDLIWENISLGGIVALDNGYSERYPGEGIATKQFLRKIRGQYRVEASPYSRQPMYWIIKTN